MISIKYKTIRNEIWFSIEKGEFNEPLRASILIAYVFKTSMRSNYCNNNHQTKYLKSS